MAKVHTNPGRMLSFFIAILFMLLSTAVASIPSDNVSAAGEAYSWSGETSINVSGGVFASPSSLSVTRQPDPVVVSGARPGEARGSVTINVNNKTCRATYFITFTRTSQGTKRALEVPGTTVTPPGAAAPCTQADLDAVWSSITESFSINGNSDNPSAENPTAQIISVRLSNDKGSADSSAASVKFHLTGNGTDNTITVNKSISTSTGQAYYLGNFTGITPGDYRICPDQIYTDCKNIEKAFNTPASVMWGVEAKINNLNVKLEYKPLTGDYTGDRTYGPFEVIIFDEDKKEASRQSVMITWTAPDECKNFGSNCPDNITVGESIDFKDLKPGKYQVCVGNKCQDFTKTDGIDEVTLAFDGKDISATPGGIDPTCTAGSLGWIMCPLVNVFGDIIQITADFLNSMLFISPIGSNPSLRQIWQTFVGIANLLLVVAFLILIFSQSTSIGLNAYGIKKMLPRIIAAAILINLSYFICTIALDVANIIGGAIGSIVQAAMPGATLSGGQGLDRTDSWVDWIKLAIPVILAAGIAAAVGAIAFLVPVLLSAALAVISIFLIVALRQALVILLVIVAPLAFAAMILPNTEQLFTKWRKLFVTMLVMYPVVMFLLYGSQLVGALLLASKNITSATGENVVNSWIIDIVATVVMTIGPFAGLYMYLKNSNKLMSMASGAISKMGSGLQGASKKWAGTMKERSTYGQIMANRKNIGNIRGQQRSFERMQKGGAWGTLATGMMGEERQRLMNTRIGKAMAGIQQETIEAHAKNLNRPAAEIISEGRLSRDGKQYLNKRTNTWDSTNTLDDLTKSALVYARSNNLTGTDEGVKAIATKLYEFGGMNASHVTNLAAMAKDKAAFMEYSAGQAAKTGMSHLKFATVTTPDKNNPNQYQIDFGGALGGGTDKVTDKLVSGGLHNISKDTWSDEDPAFAAAFAQSVINQRNLKPEVYEQGLAKMTDEQVSKMMGALNRSGNPAATQLAAQLIREHNAAINKFKP